MFYPVFYWRFNRFFNHSIFYSVLRAYFQLIKHILYYYIGLAHKNVYYCSGPEIVRVVPYTSSQKNAHEQAKLRRSWKQVPSDSLLFRPDMELHWGNDKQVAKGEKRVSQHTISEHLVKSVPPRKSEYHDLDYMGDFLVNTRIDALTFDPSRYSRRQLMPNYCSLLDFVAADSQRKDSWCVSKIRAPPSELFELMQKTKGLSLALLDHVTVREIKIGVDPEERIIRVFEWAITQWGRDQVDCPTGVISMDVEALQVLKSDYERVLESASNGDTEPVYIKNLQGGRIEKGSSTQLPVKFMFGNGTTWALMISLIAKPVPKGQFKVSPPVIHPSLLKYLKWVPRMVGVGIRPDVAQFEEVISRAIGHDFKFKGCIDLSCFAVLAGWNMKFFNMQALSVQALGAVLNKSVSCGDGRWGCAWEEIPKPLQVYCLGDVKFGHQASVLFLTMLLRDLFPDPDVVLSFSRSDAHCFMAGFSEWMCDVLQDTEVIPGLLDQAKSRAELLFSLRHRLQNGSLASSPPSRVAILSEVLGPWPSIVGGGPRFLHQVRRHFLLQCDILKAAAIPNWEKMMPYPVTVRMRTAAAYGIPDLSKLDYSIPVDKADLGLTVHPELAHLMLGDDLSSSAAASIAKQFSRVRREMVYEWCRLNLGDIQKFLDCILKDKHWSEFKRSFLYEAQMIFRRCTAQTPPDLPQVAKELTAHAHSLWMKEEKILKEMKAEFDKVYGERKARRDFFRHWGSEEQKFTFCKQSWRGEIPPATKLSETQDNEVRRAYLRDSRPSKFLREVRDEEGRIEVRYSSREEEERRLSNSAPNPPKRRKKSPVPTDSKGVGFVWDIEAELDYELELETSICDEDLLVGC